jgi:hypothetical protein
MTVAQLLKFLQDKPKDTVILLYEGYEEVYHDINKVEYDMRSEEITIR